MIQFLSLYLIMVGRGHPQFLGLHDEQLVAFCSISLSLCWQHQLNPIQGRIWRAWPWLSLGLPWCLFYLQVVGWWQGMDFEWHPWLPITRVVEVFVIHP